MMMSCKHYITHPIFSTNQMKFVCNEEVDILDILALFPSP